MILKDVLITGRSKLKSNNIDSYYLDAEILICFLLKCERIDLILKDYIDLNDKIISKYQKLINFRIKNIPIAYIIKKSYFMDFVYNVNKNVLIPRPETEILVEEILKYIKINNYKNILDIGTGSGCIPISLSSYINNLNITAIDINEKSLYVAKKNNLMYNQNIKFIKSDLFKNINQKFDVIISNPPYIKTSEIINLMDDVKNYEPILALDGGEDGLKFYKNIISKSKNYLNKNAMIFFECGYNQAEEIKNLLNKFNFKDIKILKDYSNFDRIILAKI